MRGHPTRAVEELVRLFPSSSSLHIMSTHTLKFALPDATTRLVSFPATPIPTFDSLATAIQERFDLSTTPTALVYTDEDEDEITLSSDVEVAELWTYFSSAEGGEAFEVRKFAIILLEEPAATEADSEKKKELLESIQQALKADPSLVGPIHGLLHEALGKSLGGGRHGEKHGHHHHPFGPRGFGGGRGGFKGGKHHHGRGRWEMREQSDSESESSEDEDDKKKKKNKKCKHHKHRGPPPPPPFPHPGFFGFGPPPPPPFGGRSRHHHHFGPPPPPPPPGFGPHPSPFDAPPPPPHPFHGFGKHHGGKHGHGHGHGRRGPPSPHEGFWGGFGAAAEFDPESDGAEGAHFPPTPPHHEGPFGFFGGRGGFGGRRGGRHGRGGRREREEPEQQGEQEKEWVFFARVEAGLDTR
ncbi:hypothetical protein BCR35DRAFT_103646 [Leucosporidium creatinivorum]|uniref:PB1 domain-containing protein n=1 Tax=Leucosporidium creatinivorum TaxID=106004 RepID=A0A1Y2G125_9BASI|nr:hypothetical protein BCR35DRAFT_103646 [Leucosporidium creatinivorum]